MKKEYMELECTVVSFENEDIVTTSGGGLTSYDAEGLDNVLPFDSNFRGN